MKITWSRVAVLVTFTLLTLLIYIHVRPSRDTTVRRKILPVTNRQFNGRDVDPRDVIANTGDVRRKGPAVAILTESEGTSGPRDFQTVTKSDGAGDLSDFIRDSLPLAASPETKNTDAAVGRAGDLPDFVRDSLPLAASPNTKTKLRPPDKDTVKRQHTTPQPCSKCAVLLQNDSLVRDCVTSDVIGRVPAKIRTRTFRAGVADVTMETRGHREESFREIFLNKTWGQAWDGQTHDVDGSGRGATLAWTQELTAALHTIISQIRLELGVPRIRLLDLPCGDLVWMSRFLETRDDVEYTGADIVPELIQRHRAAYRDRGWRFVHLDIVTAEELYLTSYDLILCRTLLQHLHTADAIRVLEKMSASGSRYLLTTTFSQATWNGELRLDRAENPGRFREVNLEIPPFSLTPPLCLHRDGPPRDFEGWKHFVGLWRLPLRRVVGCRRVKEFALMDTGRRVNSCVEWSPYIDLT